MKNRQLLLLTCGLALLAGCSNDDYSGPDTQGVEAKVTASINNHLTRAYDTSWESSDQIGVTGNDATQKNIAYQTSDGTGSFTVVNVGEDVVIKSDSWALTAYYPFTGTSGTVPGTEGLISGLSTTDQANQKTFDYLFASATASTTNGLANFVFDHMMSKVVFNFVAGNGVTLTNPFQYILSNLYTEGTFNTTTGEAVATTTTIGDITLTGVSASSSSIIIFPQSATDIALTIIMGGYTYKATIASLSVTTGYKYTYTATLSIDDATQTPNLSVSASSINDWNDGDSGSGETNLDAPQQDPEINPDNSDGGYSWSSGGNTSI